MRERLVLTDWLGIAGAVLAGETAEVLAGCGSIFTGSGRIRIGLKNMEAVKILFLAKIGIQET